MQKLTLPGGEIIPGKKYPEEDRSNVLIRACFNKQDRVSQKIFLKYLQRFKEICLDQRILAKKNLGENQLSEITYDLDHLNIIADHWNHLTPEEKYQLCSDIYRARVDRVHNAQRVLGL